MKSIKSTGLLSWLEVLLRITSWVLIAGIALMVILMSFGILRSLGIAELPVPGRGQVEWVSQGLRITMPGVEDGGSFFALSFGLAAVMLFLALMIVARCKAILTRVGKGTPFHPDQSRDIRNIGWIILVSELFSLIVNGIIAGKIAEYITAAGGPGIDAGVSLSLRPEVLFLGLVMLVLAQIFHQGAGMEEEQRLTV